jgi:adenosylmethionine-8-amino-7-oxononanoate aminotransferase
LAKRAGDGTPRDDRPREDRPREDRFRDDRRFTNVRQIGTIAALDIATSDPGYLAGIGPRLYNDFLARGLLVRPLGNTIYLMPPYCSTTDEIDLVFDAIGEIADGMG